MVYISITSTGGNIFPLPKINLWTACDVCLVLPTKIIVMFTFNILYVHRKIFLRSEKSSDSFRYGIHQNHKYGWKFMFIIKKINLCTAWWYLVHLSNQSIITFNMLLINGVSFFRTSLVALELWLVVHCNYQHFSCRVTGDIWPLEHHFAEVKKTSDSFTFKLQ